MKKISILAFVISLTTLSNTALANEEVRFVVKEKQSSFASQNSRIESVSKNENTSEFKVIKGQAEDLDVLRASGKYESIEIDKPAYTIKPVNYTPAYSSQSSQSRSLDAKSSSIDSEPNDPYYKDQWYWRSPLESYNMEFLGYADIFAAKKKIISTVKPRVGIIDSSFSIMADVPYSDGYSFFTGYEGYVRNPEYILTQFPLEECGYGHGNSVASIIGAKYNNGVGMSGIVDADLVIARSMLCGTGPTSDSADSIVWLAGGQVDGVPVISKPVDVINMSLSADYDFCPNFLQEAIDYAYNKGITVVAAAGNDYKGVLDKSPANCNHVVVVGAHDKYGVKSSYSNHGLYVDIMAPGESVFAMSAREEGGYWDGTSQATPIIAGMIGLAKSQFPSLNPDELQNLLKTSATIMDEVSCYTDGCGAGRLDALAFINEVTAYMLPENSFVKHVLGETDTCSGTKLVGRFGESFPLCELYEVNFDTSANFNRDSQTYKLYKVSKDLPFYLHNAVESFESDEPKIVVKDQGFGEYNFGFVRCFNGLCGTVLERIDTTDAVKPALCI